MPSKTTLPAVSLAGVSKSFGNGPILEEITVTVEEGTCFGLLGPNGAGKTTILKIIYGFIRPSAGTVTVNGHDALREPRLAKRHLGIAPQDDLLDPDLTVMENLLFHARYSRIPPVEGRRRCEEVKETMGLQAHGDEAVAHLSTGLRRRLVLARALLNDPKIVILDEPTRGLDYRSREEYIARLQGMKRRGVTLVLATHELREAEVLCDRVALMEGGKILKTGSPREVLPDQKSVPSGAREEGEDA